MPNPESSPLALFHPLIQKWFAEKIGKPTEIQRLAWPRIAAGSHVLLTAPTGSGKTLTAFLSALDRFASGAWNTGATRILYVSPLKALNNDIQRNLLSPLDDLRTVFEQAEQAFPTLRVLVRSGDTPATERRRMLRHPPEILITTPESLNLLLLSRAGRDSLRGLRTVILDEIHAVAGTKRGVHLITAVDRLAPLAGEFQRIALSATVRPLDTVAAFVGGYTFGETGYRPRPVEILAARTPKRYRLQVRYPFASEKKDEDGRPGRNPGDRGAHKGSREPFHSADQKRYSTPRLAPSTANAEGERDVWTAIAADIKRLVGEARSTLIFTNNRRLSERLARLINEGEEKPIAYAHHGSLSKEIRSVVEARMKEGRLPAIVATSSLELGIDIGALDQVILVQTPTSIASALQRVGRAGHGVGQTSVAYLFPSHGRDVADAAVAVRCILESDIEETRPVETPLDLLAQILVAMTVSETWRLDVLYAFLKTSHPYRLLSRRHFDLVVEMLAGRYADTRIRELRPRVSVDAVEGTISAVKGSALIVGLGGGTIPDRGYYALRHADTRSKIGELDEEFVWERREGEIFALGTQSWKITRITANEVEAVPAERSAQLAPFWRAEERDRDSHFSRRLGEFLETADARLQDQDAMRPGSAFESELIRDRGLDAASASGLIAFLKRQQAATGSALPHRHHLLIEECGTGPKAGRQIILHSVWGGRLNRPWAYALACAWEDRNGSPLDIVTGDDCLLLELPEGHPAADLLDLVHSDNLESLLRRRLERTGYFAAHFRENAARALLLPRSTLRSRVPLWLNRLRSSNLLQAVSRLGDFPLVLETWRECLRDEFDIPALKERLDELHQGNIRVTVTRTLEPSPFAESLVWKQTNKFMYERDKPAEGFANAGGGAGVHGGPGGQGEAGRGREDLLREIAFSSPLRPKIPVAIIKDFEAKAQRTASGYAPQDARELVEWIKERTLLAWEEWEALLPLCGKPVETDALREHGRYLTRRLVGLRLPGAETDIVVALESLPRLSAALNISREAVAPFRPLDETTLVARMLPMSGETSETLQRLWDRFPPAESPLPESDQALASNLAQWLRAYGPVTLEFPRRIFGAAFPKVEEAFEDLAEGGLAVPDSLSEGATEPELCDAGNLETLLRLMRRRLRPSFQTLPAERLPLFLAAWHGLTSPAKDAEGLQNALEKLFGFAAPAPAWETDILPARIMPYQPALLDAVFHDSDLLWFGAGKEKIAFAFPEDLNLFLPAAPASRPAPSISNASSTPSTPPDLSSDQAQVLGLLESFSPLGSRSSRMDFTALAARCPLPSDKLTEALWNLAWSGRITNDTYAALRKGVETGFRANLPQAAGSASRPSSRGRFQRWKATRPMIGNWFPLAGNTDVTYDAEGGTSDQEDSSPASGLDALELEELAKERVRQLLRRYGLLFRELLVHEPPALQWGSVFRALRLLELSGEVLSGHFFAGIPGLQFLAPSALPMLEAGLPADAVYWMSAIDPASPCALGLEGLPFALPPRLATTHLVFHGADLALVSRRLGRDLLIRVPPRHRYLASYLAPLRNLVERAFMPMKSMETETINGEPAAVSPYLEDLLDAGFEKGLKTLSLRKQR